VTNVAFDAAGPSSAGTLFTGATGTWTHVNGGNGILVGVTTFTGSSNVVTGVTYGGVTVPFLGFRVSGNDTAGGVALYGLVGGTCPTGSNTVSVSVSDSGSNHCAGSVSVANAGSLGSVVTATSSGSASSISAAYGSTTSGSLIVSAVCQGSNNGATATAPNVLRVEKLGSTGSGSDNLEMCTDPGTGSAVSPVLTIPSGDFMGVVAVEVLPAATVAPPQADVPRLPPQLLAELQARHAITADAPQPDQGTGSVRLPKPGLAGTDAPLCIAGLGGSGAGYFADQGGSPRFVLGDAVWALPGNAGRWSSGDWQGDFDTYFATRSSQGFTAAYCKPIGTTQSGNIDDNGATFDSLYPFQGGTPSTGVAGANPSSGLTSAFWARIDYMLDSAAAQGITVFLNAIGYDSDFNGGPGPLAGKSSTEFQAYGAAIGARYASQQNLIWMVADDYFGGVDTKIDAFLTGLRGAGASQPISIENYPETTSRYDDSASTALAWGTANAAFQFCYSYNRCYYMVEKAYLEASPITVIQGDGYFYQGGSSYAGGSGSFAYDRAIRQDAWHAISSGARGIIHGSEATWQWPSTAQSDAASAWYYANNAGNIRALMESLPDWHLLVPDTSSALVTAGRGTHASGFSSGGGGGQYEVAFSDSYVTASRTPDGGSGSDLAVIYLSHATTITVDQTKMVAGYQAWWVDPITGDKTSTTAGSSYNSSTPGNNSQGDPDWVLVLQAATGDTGTGSVRIPKPSLAGSGQEHDSGTGSVRIPKPSLAASGQEHDAGTGSVRLPKPALSGSGQELDAATGSVRVPKPGLSGSGQELDAATGSVRLPKPALSGAGQERDAGTGSIAIPKPGLSGTGSESGAGFGSVSLPKPGLSGSGGEKEAASGSIRLPKPALVGAGQEHDAGTGSVRIPKPGLAGSQAADSGTGSVAIPKPGLSGGTAAPRDISLAAGDPSGSPLAAGDPTGNPAATSDPAVSPLTAAAASVNPATTADPTASPLAAAAATVNPATASLVLSWAAGDATNEPGGA
jgi:hypothetical protein